MNILIDKEVGNSCHPSEDKSIAHSLYLDDLYVPHEVIEKVIRNVKTDGLIPKNSTRENKEYQWIIKMIKHHLLILKLQERAKEKPYSPGSMACLDRHVDELVRKISKALAEMLRNYYPPKP